MANTRLPLVFTDQKNHSCLKDRVEQSETTLIAAGF